ncbi:hypothetical protein COOONC_14091 [Cooperia oncophora]
MMKSPRHDFMLQARFEQPPETLCRYSLAKTIDVGAIEPDVFVDGERIFFDMPWKKIQLFKGVTIRSPPRNMNQSELEIMFASGAGLRIEESRGLLNVIVALPHGFSEVDGRLWDAPKEEPYFWEQTTTQIMVLTRFDKCSTHYRTVGLLGMRDSEISLNFFVP